MKSSYFTTEALGLCHASQLPPGRKSGARLLRLLLREGGECGWPFPPGCILSFVNVYLVVCGVMGGCMCTWEWTFPWMPEEGDSSLGAGAVSWHTWMLGTEFHKAKSARDH